MKYAIDEKNWPDDRFWRLCLPRPLSCEHLVPNGPECVDVRGLGEGKIFTLVRVNPKAAHDFRTQVAQPTLGYAHAFPKTKDKLSSLFHLSFKILFFNNTHDVLNLSSTVVV